MALDPKNPIFICPDCGRSGTEQEMRSFWHCYNIIFPKPKPKMLFVDDRSKRIHYALDVYGNEYDVTIAPNVPEALRLLSSQKWDVVSLDHDLNGHDFEDPDSTGCGMEIVRYIHKCGGWPMRNRPPEFWIHTKNMFACHLMIVGLNAMDLKAYWKPINYQTENMKYDKEGLPI